MNTRIKQLGEKVKSILLPEVDPIIWAGQGHKRGVLPVPQRIESGPVDVDMEAVFQAVIRTNTVLETDSMPSRLDLKDTHAYRARELGVKLMINTDSHGTERLRFISFGVEIARRAWCQAPDILNTRPLDKLMTLLESRGQDNGG